MEFVEKAKRAASLSSRIARLQRLIAERPDDERLFFALNGLAKRAEAARAAFSEVAEISSIEVLDYRVSHLEKDYPVLSVTESLSDFQSSITALHDAVINGPKAKARYSAEMLAQTTLNLEFFYPGSKGFVLSVPSSTDLFGGSLDRTSDALREFLAVRSTDEARDAARVLGLAAISVLYRWVATNARWGNSIDYEWKARKGKDAGQFVPSDRFFDLQEIIRGAEETAEDVFQVRGVLLGLDVEQRRFHFAVPGGDSIKGRLLDGYDIGEKTIPRLYLAKFMRTVTRVASTGEEREAFTLLNLQDEVGSPV